MGILDKVKNAAGVAKEKVTNFAEEKQIGEKLSKTGDSIKKSFSDSREAARKYKEEANELKKPLEGAIIRYDFTYIGGLDDIPKAKSGAWGMNVMQDRFAFRVTATTKDWLHDYDIPYDNITDIRIEKRTISTAEVFLGGGNDPNQEQENVIVIEYTDENNRKATLRVEMLTGVTIFNQAAKCKELMDVLRKNDILDRIKKSETSQAVQAPDALEQLEKLSKLKDSGIISEEEFEAKKAVLLAKL